MPFKHNSTGIKEQGTYKLLPKDWFDFKIIDAKEGLSKKGYPMITLEAEVINNPEYNKRVIRHYVVFLPAGEKGDWMSVYFRKCIGMPYGGDDEVDCSKWVGRRFRGLVGENVYVNAQGEKKTTNRIERIEGVVQPAVVDEEVPF
jgi:hypothetical protein